VLWGGGGTFDPRVVGTTGAPDLPDFYKELMNSGIFDWLNEYKTPSQTIGRGTFVGSYTLNPSPAHNGQAITDSDVQAELSALLDSGGVPKAGGPTDPFDYVYMINFPQGRDLVTPDGVHSCVAHGFCGYHGTLAYSARGVYYAVLPSLLDGLCATNCGSADPLGNQTSVASHELAEMITDPQVGFYDETKPLGAPLAWFETWWSEIGDMCNADQWPFLAYQVQRLWSNVHNQCYTTSACTDPASCTGKCGIVTNACGVQVDCGGCTAPQTCGGGGVANVCGCTRVPNPCKSNQCSGSFPDGCGGVYQCHADCSVNGLCPCRGGQCTAGFCACYKGTCN
jgi:hypothetical protein